MGYGHDLSLVSHCTLNSGDPWHLKGAMVCMLWYGVVILEGFSHQSFYLLRVVVVRRQADIFAHVAMSCYLIACAQMDIGTDVTTAHSLVCWVPGSYDA